jgi:hypothetical protein
MLGTVAASACSCGIPKALSKEQIRAWLIDQSSHVAIVRISGMSIARQPDADPEAVADAILIKPIKGTMPKHFKIRSFGGDEGANCGSATSLFEAASRQETLTVSLTSDKTRKGMFWIDLCGLVELGGFGSASQ